MPHHELRCAKLAAAKKLDMQTPDVFVVADNIYSPLGATTAENFAQLWRGILGVQRHVDERLSPTPVFASLFSSPHGDDRYTKFESLLIASISDALQQSGIDASNDKTLLIISTTKGNISLLETEDNTPELHQRVALSTSARMVAEHFRFTYTPLVVSNACISGVMAVITAMRLLRAGKYENVVVSGADVISKFIVSGFQSFQALSNGVCKPFDESRSGLNLGEGAATIILSTKKKHSGNIRVKGGAVSNDANHISGPSRTGDELGFAITQSLKDAGLSASDIGFISAHGTATPYNDEMEANAIRVAGLIEVPLNSLKGYYGHTLGAAGLIESVVSLQSLREGLIIGTPGFEQLGVSSAVNVCASPTQVNGRNFVKTASGFGGCNAAVVFGR